MKVTGIVLAGGMGRRMGGVDKGLVPFQGKPLVAHVLERLRPQVDEILVNANRETDTYARFGYPVVSDAIGGFAGPLAGLHCGMTAAATELVATVPCDSPFLPADLIARLLKALQQNDADLAVAKTGDQPHPLFCLCRKALLHEVSTKNPPGITFDHALFDLSQVTELPAEQFDVLQDYFYHASEDLAAARDACQKRLPEELRRSAHRIKGASRLIGSMMIAFLCEKLERISVHENWNLANEYIVQIEMEISRLQQSVQSEFPQFKEKSRGV